MARSFRDKETGRLGYLMGTAIINGVMRWFQLHPVQDDLRQTGQVAFQCRTGQVRALSHARCFKGFFFFFGPSSYCEAQARKAGLARPKRGSRGVAAAQFALGLGRAEDTIRSKAFSCSSPQPGERSGHHGMPTSPQGLTTATAVRLQGASV